MTKPSRRLLTATITLAALGLTGACASYDDVPPSAAEKMDGAPANCATIKGWSYVRDTLLPKCAGSACHDPGNTRSVVDLTPAVAYQLTVGKDSRALPSMKLVEPGKPSRSFLYRKLTASQATACQTEGAPTSQCGAQMPLNDWFALPEEWVEETRIWIACGARP